MTQRSFKVNTLVLVGAIVLHLALPFTNGVVCSLPETQDATAFFSLASFTRDGQLPSFAANDSSHPEGFPEFQPQPGAHAAAASTAWDPMLVTLSLPTFVLRPPQAVPADRFTTNTFAIPIWRPPIPFHSSL